MPLPIGQEHASGRRGSRTLKAGYPRSGWLDCFRDSCHRQLACPSVSSCGGRNRTGEGTLNRRLPVPTQAPPQCESGRRDLNPRSQAPRACAIPDFATPWSKSARADLNRRSRAPATTALRRGARRVSRLPHAPMIERPAGVEPALPPWQGDQLASCQSVPGCHYIMGA